MLQYNPQTAIEFSPEHERVLRGLTIDESGPGTVLHDFEALLAFLAEGERQVTRTHQLRLHMLPEINARLARPLELGLKRPQQKSYPPIHGLYLLVRASGLTRIEGTSGKPLLVVDGAVHRVWQGLNPTERYCTLLEAWLLRGHPEIIGERGRPWVCFPGAFGEWQWFFLRIPDEGLPIAGDKGAEILLRYTPGWHNLGLLDVFGFISVRPGPPEPGKGWRIERIDRTPLGDALLALLQAEFFGDIDHILQLESEGKIPFGLLQPALQPYFPEWRNNLSVPERAFREGTHVFKVSLGRTWRRIAIPADQTLDALASAILNAVRFSHDHLYAFSYRNRLGTLERAYHPYMDEGPWATEVRIGDVPLPVGQTMTYLYDFGDRWRFDVTLERVDPGLAVEGPVVLEQHGEPPPQYGR
jgi:hypothetical protein